MIGLPWCLSLKLMSENLMFFDLMPWCLSLKLMSEYLIFFDWMPWCLSLKLMAENLMFFDWMHLMCEFGTHLRMFDMFRLDSFCLQV